jgi:hypothetical protein
MPYFKGTSLKEAMEYDYITLYNLVKNREEYLQDTVNRDREAAEEVQETMTGENL